MPFNTGRNFNLTSYITKLYEIFNKSANDTVAHFDFLKKKAIDVGTVELKSNLSSFIAFSTNCVDISNGVKEYPGIFYMEYWQMTCK